MRNNNESFALRLWTNFDPFDLICRLHPLPYAWATACTFEISASWPEQLILHIVVEWEHVRCLAFPVGDAACATSNRDAAVAVCAHSTEAVCSTGPAKAPSIIEAERQACSAADCEASGQTPSAL